ncbi:hypothetical protein EYR38_006722 [Pleurotus pulmonarius]|nr:hypothetical protein EYR38_006722 [Pleurotus pulmonarius]
MTGTAYLRRKASEAVTRYPGTVRRECETAYKSLEVRVTPTASVMTAQLPLDKTFLVAAWAEAIAYGFLVCLFCATLFFTFGTGLRHDFHGKVMICVSCTMFFVASWHLAMNGYRLIEGFTEHALTPGGPVAYFGNLRTWDHVLKDTLYATQEILGNAAAIYRCYILWGQDWRVISLPLLLMVGSVVSGYTVCALFVKVDPNQTVFDPLLNSWIRAFYSIAVVQNIITTSLMAFRIWRTTHQSAKFRTDKGLIPILRILVESAALQLVVEILLLALYCSNINAQYILLELVTPVVGITFNAITIRIRLRALNTASAGSGITKSDHVQTIGSVPMRRRIHVDITKEVEDDMEKSTDYRVIDISHGSRV